MFKQLTAALMAASTIAGCSSVDNPPAQQSLYHSLQLDTRVGPLAANLYLPKGVENPPIVIVTGAWTTVKEQMPAVYAERLAEQGYAALTFDFRGWGQSQRGTPYLEDPQRKTDDIRAVIDAVTQLDGVDSSRLAGLGICASSGYMLDAAVDNNKIKAVAVVAPWLHDKALATDIYGGPQSVAGLLQTADQAAAQSEPNIIEAASLTNEGALMYQVPYYTETDRGLIPQYDNKFNPASWSGWLNYDAQLSASQLQQPALLIASESMAIPAGAHQYLEKAGENIHSVWFDGYSQFDFYDQPQAVADSVKALDQFFAKNL